MTVRLQLALWNALIIFLTIGGLGWVLPAKVRLSMTNGIRAEMQTRANQFDIMFRVAPGERRPLPPEFRRERGLPPLPFRGEDSFFPRAFGPDARPALPGDTRTPFDRAALEKANATSEPLFTTVYTAGDAPLLIYTIPNRRTPFSDHTILQYAATLAPVENAVLILTGALLGLIPVALAVAVVGAVFLTDRALRPVAAVTRAAARIGENDLSRRLPVSGGDEFGRLSATLNGMLARLEIAFERERRFSADASHELKSPLTIIKANSSLALTDASLPANARLALSEIDAAADRTSRIVQDLLLLARSDAGDLTPQREIFPVRPLLEELGRVSRRQSNAAEIVVDAPESLRLNADREQMRRLLGNLLDNALRHTPPTGVITLSAYPSAGGVALTVADTGEGIAPEHLPRLGERFFRPDAARARATGGTGLGLSICRAIAAAHGATMTVDSELGVGTTVRVQI